MLRGPSLTGKATDRKTWYKASMLWSASAKTKNPEAAIAWINWFANDQAAANIDKAERGIPPNSELLTAVTPKLSPAQQTVAKYITDIKTEVATTPLAPPPGGGTLANRPAASCSATRSRCFSGDRALLTPPRSSWTRSSRTCRSEP